MVSAIAEFLVEFPLDGSKEITPPAQSKQAKAPPAVRVENTAELVREAEERGRREGRAEAQAELEHALAEERARSDERLAAERQAWVRDEANRLASQLASAIEALEGRLVERVARILTPFLIETLRSQMLAELRLALSTLLTDRQERIIRISGPEDLLSALSGELDKYQAAIEFVPGEGPDVSVVAGDTVIETQLAAWSQRLLQAIQPS